MEQLSLFDNPYTTKEEIAQKICDEYNSIDTVWKGTFRVKSIELAVWHHSYDPEKVLSITLKPELNGNYLMQFEGDRESQKRVYNIDTPFIRKLAKDKDFAICVTPWVVYIFWHKFERKKVVL